MLLKICAEIPAPAALGMESDIITGQHCRISLLVEAVVLPVFRIKNINTEPAALELSVCHYLTKHLLAYAAEAHHQYFHVFCSTPLFIKVYGIAERIFLYQQSGCKLGSVKHLRITVTVMLAQCLQCIAVPFFTPQKHQLRVLRRYLCGF